MVEFTRLDDLRQRSPLLHCVSNTVTANDCANLVLAVGASPIMAHAPEEMGEITAASAATVLNTGTPDSRRFDTCLLCGREAARLGRPVVLDPVGVGASAWRLERVEGLLSAFTPTILRVNLGEAQALLGVTGQERGVDSPRDAPELGAETAARLARRLGTAVLLSGREDIVAGGGRCWRVAGGSGRMGQVTGTGCMLSVLCGAFAAVEPEGVRAALLAAAFWKVCARRAEKGAAGPGSFRTALMDAAGTLAAGELAREARITAL